MRHVCRMSSSLYHSICKKKQLPILGLVSRWFLVENLFMDIAEIWKYSSLVKQKSINLNFFIMYEFILLAVPDREERGFEKGREKQDTSQSCGCE